MRKRILNIFTITLLATVFGQGVAYAQEEGEELPLKPESTVVEKDTVQEIRPAGDELRSDFINPIIITPKTNTVNLLDLNQTPTNVTPAKKSSVAGEKVKEEEPQSNLKFNFIYYLFYKFKVGSSSSGGK